MRDRGFVPRRKSDSASQRLLEQRHASVPACAYASTYACKSEMKVRRVAAFSVVTPLRKRGALGFGNVAGVTPVITVGLATVVSMRLVLKRIEDECDAASSIDFLRTVSHQYFTCST